jgi:hypothetical protein
VGQPGDRCGPCRACAGRRATCLPRCARRAWSPRTPAGRRCATRGAAAPTRACRVRAVLVLRRAGLGAACWLPSAHGCWWATTHAFHACLTRLDPSNLAPPPAPKHTHTHPPTPITHNTKLCLPPYPLTPIHATPAAALGQVVALLLRSSGRPRDAPPAAAAELDYPALLNRVLPPDIRVLGWADAPQGFSARQGRRWRGSPGGGGHAGGPWKFGWRCQPGGSQVACVQRATASPQAERSAACCAGSRRSTASTST